MSKEFGERLKKALNEAGHTQKSASEELGLSKNAMTNYAGGRIPEAMILYRIAKLSSVSMEWLLTGEEHAPNGDQVSSTEEGAHLPGLEVEVRDIELLTKIKQLSRDNRIKVEGVIEGMLLGQGGASQPTRNVGTSSRSISGEEAAARDAG
jgi:transcriptional regulator with XRE-family HTH domain